MKESLWWVGAAQGTHHPPVSPLHIINASDANALNTRLSATLQWFKVKCAGMVQSNYQSNQEPLVGYKWRQSTLKELEPFCNEEWPNFLDALNCCIQPPKDIFSVPGCFTTLFKSRHTQYNRKSERDALQSFPQQQTNTKCEVRGEFSMSL